MILTEGIWLCLPAESRIVSAHVADVNTQQNLEFGEPENWPRSGMSPDTKEPWEGNSFGGLTTVESIRDLPCWMRELFLPVLLGGGDIQLKSISGGSVVPAYGYYMRDQKEPFWIRVVFFFAK